jgi:hypothetical protein
MEVIQVAIIVSRGLGQAFEPSQHALVLLVPSRCHGAAHFTYGPHL